MTSASQLSHDAIWRHPPAAARRCAIRADGVLRVVPASRLATRDLDPRRRRSVLVGDRRRRLHGRARPWQLAGRRARRSAGAESFDSCVRGRELRYRPVRLGLDRDLLRRLSRAGRARAVVAGRVRVSLRAARRADDADGLVAAAALARRRAQCRRGCARREPAVRGEHARRRGRRCRGRLVPARQPRLRRHGSAREQLESPRGRRGARAVARGAAGAIARRRCASRAPAAPLRLRSASGRGSRSMRPRAPPRSRSRSSTSGSSTASCARTPTRSRTC